MEEKIRIIYGGHGSAIRNKVGLHFHEIAKDAMSAHIVIDVTGESKRFLSYYDLYNIITNSKLSEEMVNFSLIKRSRRRSHKSKRKSNQSIKFLIPMESIVRQPIAMGVPIVRWIDGWVKFSSA